MLPVSVRGELDALKLDSEARLVRLIEIARDLDTDDFTRSEILKSLGVGGGYEFGSVWLASRKRGGGRDVPLSEDAHTWRVGQLAIGCLRVRPELWSDPAFLVELRFWLDGVVYPPDAPLSVLRPGAIIQMLSLEGASLYVSIEGACHFYAQSPESILFEYPHGSILQRLGDKVIMATNEGWKIKEAGDALVAFIEAVNRAKSDLDARYVCYVSPLSDVRPEIAPKVEADVPPHDESRIISLFEGQTEVLISDGELAGIIVYRQMEAFGRCIPYTGDVKRVPNVFGRLIPATAQLKQLFAAWRAEGGYDV